jgi:hypothetical protein
MGSTSVGNQRGPQPPRTLPKPSRRAQRRRACCARHMGQKARLGSRLAFVETIAGDRLSTTLGAALDVTPHDVKFTFDDATVVTGTLVGSPIIGFVSIPNPLKVGAPKVVVRDGLSFLDLLWPALDHSGASVDHKLLRFLVFHAHGVLLLGLRHAAPDDAAHEFNGVQIRGFGDINEFQHVNPALASFDAPHKVIRPFQLFSEFSLAESDCVARINNRCNQSSMPCTSQMLHFRSASILEAHEILHSGPCLGNGSSSSMENACYRFVAFAS